MYKKAIKLKLRFDSSKGMSSLTIEDLYNLPLTSKSNASLQEVAQIIGSQLKNPEVEDYVGEKSTTDTILQLKMDIVKDVIADKLEERESTKNAKADKAEREKIMAIIARKQDTELENMSVEDLNKLLDAKK
jgi:phosphoribosylformylglycinamidine (FGAM) synthase PurS component